jgi:hypothetical protein
MIVEFTGLRIEPMIIGGMSRRSKRAEPPLVPLVPRASRGPLARAAGTAPVAVVVGAVDGGVPSASAVIRSR